MAEIENTDVNIAQTTDDVDAKGGESTIEPLSKEEAMAEPTAAEHGDAVVPLSNEGEVAELPVREVESTEPTAIPAAVGEAVESSVPTELSAEGETAAEQSAAVPEPPSNEDRDTPLVELPAKEGEATAEPAAVIIESAGKEGEAVEKVAEKEAAETVEKAETVVDDTALLDELFQDTKKEVDPAVERPKKDDAPEIPSGSIVNLFKKAEKKSMSQRQAEATEARKRDTKTPTAATTPCSKDLGKKTSTKRAAAPSMRGHGTGVDGDISLCFKKLPSKHEKAAQKQREREEEQARLEKIRLEEEHQREVEAKRKSKNFLYNKDNTRLVPESFHSEKFRDVPLGSLVNDPDILKASSMKTVRMDEYLAKLTGKPMVKKSDRPESSAPPAKRSKKQS